MPYAHRSTESNRDKIRVAHHTGDDATQDTTKRVSEAKLARLVHDVRHDDLAERADAARIEREAAQRARGDDYGEGHRSGWADDDAPAPLTAAEKWEVLAMRLSRESVLSVALTLPCPAGHADPGDYCIGGPDGSSGVRACCQKRVEAAAVEKARRSSEAGIDPVSLRENDGLGGDGDRVRRTRRRIGYTGPAVVK